MFVSLLLIYSSSDFEEKKMANVSERVTQVVFCSLDSNCFRLDGIAFRTAHHLVGLLVVHRWHLYAETETIIDWNGWLVDVKRSA